MTSESNHTYRYAITNNATSTPSASDSISALSKSDNNFITNGLGKYIALNQDLYLWVWESDYKNEELVVKGVKIEKPELPKYTNAFTDSCHLVHNSTIITFNFPIGNTKDQSRKINVKVGKISDNKLLQKLYKENEAGFSDLLNYAKTSDSLYNNTITSNHFSGYFTPDESLPNFDSSKLEDDAYYFLYVELDDENGKYIPAEAVTFAQASLYNDTGAWYLFFYGSSDFQWSNMDIGTETDDKKDEQKPNNDNTVSNKIIPATGEKAVIGIIALLLIITVATRFKLKNKYNGIK